VPGDYIDFLVLCTQTLCMEVAASSTSTPRRTTKCPPAVPRAKIRPRSSPIARGSVRWSQLQPRYHAPNLAGQPLAVAVRVDRGAQNRAGSHVRTDARRDKTATDNSSPCPSTHITVTSLLTSQPASVHPCMFGSES
jgi:hypothetical protein